MPTNYDELSKESKEFYAQQRQAAQNQKVATYDQQANTINSNYDFSVSEASKAYEDKYHENAIQKLVNERQVAESMANMGISNSGLNRTQQTAVQLSYANQKAALDRQKQQQVDTLERDRATALTENESNRQAALESVNQYYDSLEQDMTNSRYNTEVEAATAVKNAEIEAANKLALQQLEYEAEYNKALALKQLELDADNEKKASYIISTNGGLLSRDFTGTLAENGISVYKDNEGDYVYVDNNSGKKTTLPAGTNPFTGTVNPDAKGIGNTFSNGYQPNNINGTKLTKADAKINVDGNEQSVWAANGKYYFWKGKENKYLELTESEIEELGLPTTSKILSTASAVKNVTRFKK